MERTTLTGKSVTELAQELQTAPPDEVLGRMADHWWGATRALLELAGPAFVDMVRNPETTPWDSTVAVMALLSASYLMDREGSYTGLEDVLVEVLALRDHPRVLSDLGLVFPATLTDTQDPVSRFIEHLALARISPGLPGAPRFLEEREYLVAELEGRFARDMGIMAHILGDHPLLDQACLECWDRWDTPPMTAEEVQQAITRSAQDLGILPKD